MGGPRKWPDDVKGEPLPPKKELSLNGLSEGTVSWYRAAYAIMTFDPGFDDEIAWTANLVLNGCSRYEAVCKRVGWSTDLWWIIGGIHYKEASCAWNKALHNGDEVIGNGKKTYRVPAGRGPFSTWEDAAVDAITLNGGRWIKIKAAGSDIGEILYAVERFNGTGYISGAGRAETSPYLWDMTSINDGVGRYVVDGKFDPNAKGNRSAGFAAIVKRLEQLGEVSIKTAA